MTQFRVGQPPSVVFARAALTALSPAAMQRLAAHELAHTIRRARTRPRSATPWLLGYLALMGAGLSFTAAALAASPRVGELALIGTLAAAVACLGLHVVSDRREEIAANPLRSP